jgi:hypothetical protein
MDKNEFAPRNIAKGVVKSIVAIKTSQFAKNQITDYTRFEEDDMIVKISTGIIGGYVASRLSPVTDYAVDKTADFVVAKWHAHRTRRTTSPKTRSKSK